MSILAAVMSLFVGYAGVASLAAGFSLNIVPLAVLGILMAIGGLVGVAAAAENPF